METDTIRNGMVFHLADDDWEIAANVDKATGSATCRIAIVPDEVTVAEDNDSQKKYWQDIRTNQKKLYFRTRFDFMMKQACQKISRKGKTSLNQISGSADEAKKRNKQNLHFYYEENITYHRRIDYQRLRIGTTND